MPDKTKKLSLLAVLSLMAGMGFTALVIGIGNGGWETRAWLLSGLLLSAGFFLLALALSWAGGAKALVWITLAGLVLRLAVSIGLTTALPVFGYDNQEHQAGYIFADSFDRDTQAWTLAESGQPVLAAFENQYLSDQYGGLLAILALQYRVLSPDAHRQMLPLLFSALVFAMAVPFLWKALAKRWNPRVAMAAALIFVFYPEAVLLSSAHMREPYLIFLGAAATWAVIDWQSNRRANAAILAACLAGLALISWRSGIVIAGILFVWLFLDQVMERWQPTRRVWGWLIVIAGGSAVAVVSYPWIRETAVYDTYNTVQSSGLLQYVFRNIGDRFQLPIVTAFGLTQPLLPAALVAISNPLASAIAILRSLGWYLLIPLMFFAFFASWKAQPARDRRVLIWLTSILVVWILVSSYRAGGDIWDNPRYRTILLPWLALTAGWALDWALARRNPWLWRIYLIEFLGLVIITNWYLTRYAKAGIRINFYWNFGIVLIVAVLVAAIWVLLDWRRKKKQRSK